MGTSTLALVTAFAGIFAAAFLRHAFDMRKEQRSREMAGSIFWGLTPLGIVCLIWAATGDSPMRIQNAVLGCFGAAMGAAALIWLGYVVRPADAQKTSLEKPTQPFQASVAPDTLSFEDASLTARGVLLDVARFGIGDTALRNDSDQRLAFWARHLAARVSIYRNDGKRLDPVPTPLIAQNGKLFAGNVDLLYVKRHELDAAIAQMRADYPNPQPGSITMHDSAGSEIARNKANSIAVAKSPGTKINDNDLK
jgi:hypothetical protein